MNYTCKTSEITALDKAEKIQSAWRAKNQYKIEELIALGMHLKLIKGKRVMNCAESKNC